MREVLLMGTLAVAACAMSSAPMDMGGGVYMISAQASPLRGGAAGANDAAYAEANKFCGSRAKGAHAIVVGRDERDIYATSVSGGPTAFGGSTAAWGNAPIRFRCGS